MYKISHLIAKISADTKAPRWWILLFKSGLGKLAYGTEFLVNREAFAMIRALIPERGNDVHFDYEHASLDKKVAPAAGWINELAWEDGAVLKISILVFPDM